MVCQRCEGFLFALLSSLSMLSTGCFWYACIRSCLKASSKHLISCYDCGSLGAALSSREECRGSYHLHGQAWHAHHSQAQTLGWWSPKTLTSLIYKTFKEESVIGVLTFPRLTVFPQPVCVEPTVTAWPLLPKSKFCFQGALLNLLETSSFLSVWLNQNYQNEFNYLPPKQIPN